MDGRLAVGEMTEGDEGGFIRREIRRDEQPFRFNCMLGVTVFASVVCLALAAFLLW